MARRKGARYPSDNDEKSRERNKQRYAKAKEWLYPLKSRPCTDCHQIFPPVCMQFDHVPGRGEKLFEVNMNSASTRKLETVLLELAKCDLVCSNCHCIRTALRRN